MLLTMMVISSHSKLLYHLRQLLPVSTQERKHSFCKNAVFFVLVPYFFHPERKHSFFKNAAFFALMPYFYIPSRVKAKCLPCGSSLT